MAVFWFASDGVSGVGEEGPVCVTSGGETVGRGDAVGESVASEFASGEPIDGTSFGGNSATNDSAGAGELAGGESADSEPIDGE